MKNRAPRCVLEFSFPLLPLFNFIFLPCGVYLFSLIPPPRKDSISNIRS